MVPTVPTATVTIVNTNINILEIHPPYRGLRKDNGFKGVRFRRDELFKRSILFILIKKVIYFPKTKKNYLSIPSS